MKCKRCRSVVPDSSDACPNCGQDLSSLRQLLKDFYDEDPVRVEDLKSPRAEPEVFSEPRRTEAPAPDFRMQTRSGPDLEPEITLQDPIPEEEYDEEEEETSPWDRALRGGFWLRYLAFSTDQVILLLLLAIFVVLGFLSLAMAPSAGREIPFLRQLRIVVPVIFPLWFALNIAYFTFFHGSWGQTIGKMIFGLRVVRPDGQPLTYSRALLRTFGYFVSALPLFLGFLWVAFSRGKRSWHDVLSDTLVAREQ